MMFRLIQNTAFPLIRQALISIVSCVHGRKEIHTVKRQQPYEIILDNRVNEIVKTRYGGNPYAVIEAAKNKGIQTDSWYIAAVEMAKTELAEGRTV